MKDYEKQATDFLTKNGIEIVTKYTGHARYFEEGPEESPRAVFDVIIRRKDEHKKAFMFTFGDSLNNSYKHRAGRRTYPPTDLDYTQPTHKNPSNYDILAGISGESHDPETFEDFCSEFGYDTDSRKAERVYFACQKQYKKITGFFTAAELEELREIY